MMNIFAPLLLIALVFCNTLFAQGNASNISLLIPPAYNGMGRGGVALTNYSPESAYYNPAHLSKAARKVAYAIDFQPGSQDWIFELDYFSSAIAAGFNSEDGWAGINRLAFGLRQYRFETTSDETFNQIPGFKEEAIAATFSLGFTRIIDVDFGLTLKQAKGESQFVTVNDPDITSTGKATTYDAGLLLTLPLLDPARKSLFGSPAAKKSSFSNSLSFTLGYSLQNWPGEIEYSNIPDGLSPLPHNGRLGFALEWTLLQTLRGERIPVLEAALISEAEKLLLEDGRNPESTVPFGKMNPLKNIFAFQGDDDVTNHWGIRVGAMDIFRFSFGGYDGAGFEDQETWELELRTGGLIRIMTPNLQSDHFLRRIDLRYRFSNFLNIEGLTDNAIGFHGISLVFRQK